MGRERAREQARGGNLSTHMKGRFNSLIDIALWTSKLCRVFSLEVYNKVKIVPHVVFMFRVMVKCYIFVFKIPSR